MIGLITLGEKCAGKRSAGNPHAAFEAAGTGNGATARPIRARRGKPRIQTRMILTGHRASPRPYRARDGTHFRPSGVTEAAVGESWFERAFVWRVAHS